MAFARDISANDLLDTIAAGFNLSRYPRQLNATPNGRLQKKAGYLNATLACQARGDESREGFVGMRTWARGHASARRR